MTAATTDITTGLGTQWTEAWDRDTESVGDVLLEEAFVRIIEPTVYRIEDSALDAWRALCKEHLPAAQYETAARYHKEHLPAAQYETAARYHGLLANTVYSHTSAVSRIARAMVRGMRAGVDLSLTMEQIFQQVCIAGGLESRADAEALALSAYPPVYLDQFRALFPDVRLGNTADGDDDEQKGVAG